MRIRAMALNTFREAVRDKVLYVLLLFACTAIFGSKALGWISLGQDIKIVKDVSLAAVSVFGALITIFVGTNIVYKEIDKRTIYTILCRPIHRFEFILGKFCGLVLLLAVITGVMSVVSALYVAILGGDVDGVFFAAAFLIYVKLVLLTALAVLLSSLTSPILGALIVFSVYVLGHATGILIDLPAQVRESATGRILEFLYYVIPNLSNMDLTAEAANGVAVNYAYVAWATGYGLVYTAMLLALASLAFQDKDV